MPERDLTPSKADVDLSTIDFGRLFFKLPNKPSADSATAPQQSAGLDSKEGIIENNPSPIEYNVPSMPDPSLAAAAPLAGSFELPLTTLTISAIDFLNESNILDIAGANATPKPTDRAPFPISITVFVTGASLSSKLPASPRDIDEVKDFLPLLVIWPKIFFRVELTS